jgi:hypothetical protein
MATTCGSRRDRNQCRVDSGGELRGRDRTCRGAFVVRVSSAPAFTPRLDE